jgi:hypothetical protein
MLAFGKGDFSVRLPTGWSGLQGRIADLFNEVVEMSERRAQQAAEVARIVGKEGRLRQRISTGGFMGDWAEESSIVSRMNTVGIEDPRSALRDDLAVTSPEEGTRSGPFRPHPHAALSPSKQPRKRLMVPSRRLLRPFSLLMTIQEISLRLKASWRAETTPSPRLKAAMRRSSP